MAGRRAGVSEVSHVVWSGTQRGCAVRAVEFWHELRVVFGRNVRRGKRCRTRRGTTTRQPRVEAERVSYVRAI